MHSWEACSTHVHHIGGHKATAAVDVKIGASAIQHRSRQAAGQASEDIDIIHVHILYCMQVGSTHGEGVLPAP
jgi:hypothetical protein